MKHHLNTSETGFVRDKILLTLVLYALVRSGEALAGDAASGTDATAKIDALHERSPAPAASTLIDPAVAARQFSTANSFSATEFRPHLPVQLQAETSHGGFVMDEAMIGSTTVWQQLRQFRSQDRVRLLTLWQTRASTVSLQADKHGGPSLQWSSPWMIHDVSSHGLLDRLFNVPARGAASHSFAARPAAAASPPKSAGLTSTAVN